MPHGGAIAVVPRSAYPVGVPRKPMDDDATRNLKPEDATQVAPKGTKIGKLRRSEVLADFRKIAKPKH